MARPALARSCRSWQNVFRVRFDASPSPPPRRDGDLVRDGRVDGGQRSSSSSPAPDSGRGCAFDSKAWMQVQLRLDIRRSRTWSLELGG